MSCLCLFFIFAFERFPLAVRSVLEYGELCQWTISRTKCLCPPKNASVEILTLTVLTPAARYLGDNRIWGQSPGPVISVLVYSIRELLIACVLSAGWVTRRCQQTTMQKTDLSRTPQWPQLFQFLNLWETPAVSTLLGPWWCVTVPTLGQHHGLVVWRGVPLPHPMVSSFISSWFDSYKDPPDKCQHTAISAWTKKSPELGLGSIRLVKWRSTTNHQVAY